MQKILSRFFLITILICNLIIIESVAQLNLVGQLRTRTELRDGLGNLVPKDASKSFFTSQRTRLTLGYKWDRVNFGVALQDVRVWGQDASTISGSDGNRLMMHEGWTEVILANKKDSTFKFKSLDQLSIKIGRQELGYDDARLIGNLDWLQQGRRHDMAMIKGIHKGWQFDIGLAFNQNTDAFNLTGTTFTPGNTSLYMNNSKGILVPIPAGTIPNGASFTSNIGTNGASQSYKSFKSIYATKKYHLTKYSALFFNDDFAKYNLDTLVGNIANGYLFGKDFRNKKGTNSRITYGLMINQNFGNPTKFGTLSIQGAYYQQSGKNRDGIDLNAHHYTLSGTYQKNKISATLGYDALSGNDGSSTLNNFTSSDGVDHRFDPLYGTPHKHWGYMDYFYVGTNSPAGGLENAYFKIKYSTPRTSIGVDIHSFSLNKATLKSENELLRKKLGTEIDCLLSYNINRFTNLEMGYSIMKATDNMIYAKGQATNENTALKFNKNGNWFYMMLNIKPSLK